MRRREITILAPPYPRTPVPSTSTLVPRQSHSQREWHHTADEVVAHEVEHIGGRHNHLHHPANSHQGEEQPVAAPTVDDEDIEGVDLHHQSEIPVRSGLDDAVGVFVEEVDGHRQLCCYAVPRIDGRPVVVTQEVDSDKEQVAPYHQAEKLAEVTEKERKRRRQRRRRGPPFSPRGGYIPIVRGYICSRVCGGYITIVRGYICSCVCGVYISIVRGYICSPLGG